MIAAKYKDYVIKMRRELHKIPEAGFKEFKTSKFIKDELNKMGISFKECAGTGVIGLIEGSKPGKTIGLRADIDALSVNEKNDVEYKSTHPGMMHACGHDSHAAMLLTAAKVLMEEKNNLNGNVKLIFQPSEEGPVHGAGVMVEEGAAEGIDSFFGLHVMANIDKGKITCDEGPRMASADFFEITVTGSSGHAAYPHDCVDATVIGASIVMNLQTLVSRELTPLEPFVITVGAFESGTRHNVISGKAVLKGTTRTFNNETREKLPEMIERVAKNIAKAYRGDASLSYQHGTKPLINDAKTSAMVRSVGAKLVGEENVVSAPISMGGEDFSEFLYCAPGAIAFIGVRNEEKGITYPIHHDCFNMDEDALPIGASLLAEYAIEYLK